MLVGRSRQRDRHLTAEHGIAHLDHVARSVDVRIARAEPFVDDDVPARTDLKPGGVGELGARTNARRDHGEIDGEARAIVQNRLHAIRLLHKIGDDTSEPEIDPRAAELEADEPRPDHEDALRRPELRHDAVHVGERPEVRHVRMRRVRVGG